MAKGVSKGVQAYMLLPILASEVAYIQNLIKKQRDSHSPLLTPPPPPNPLERKVIL